MHCFSLCERIGCIFAEGPLKKIVSSSQWMIEVIDSLTMNLYQCKASVNFCLYSTHRQRLLKAHRTTTNLSILIVHLNEISAAWMLLTKQGMLLHHIHQFCLMTNFGQQYVVRSKINSNLISSLADLLCLLSVHSHSTCIFPGINQKSTVFFWRDFCFGCCCCC